MNHECSALVFRGIGTSAPPVGPPRPWTACAFVGLLVVAGCSANAADPASGSPESVAETASDGGGSGDARDVLGESPEADSGTSPPVFDDPLGTPTTGPILAAVGSPGGSGTPPETWKEHWKEHTQDLQLVANNDWVAMYFDKDVDRQGTEWMLPFMTEVWKYTVAHYGQFTDGQRDGRLYAIFHQGKYSGGHPSTYLEQSHDYRNVSDIGPGPWQQVAYDIASHEVSHIVEYATRGIFGTPTATLWRDSKFAEIFQYDLYMGIGKTAEAAKLWRRFLAIKDSYPRADSYWFRDWFYPIWRDHGGAELMPRYFQLIAENYPKRGLEYARSLNFGEFVHFMSGAAKTNLKAQATFAFDWPEEREVEFKKAQAEF